MTVWYGSGNMLTLPDWVAQWVGVKLDIVRKTIRRSPELRALGRRYGATKVYDESEASRIRDAVMRAGTTEVSDRSDER